MHISTIIHGIGSIGLFPARAFLPAFLTALALRLGPEIEWVRDVGILEHIEGTPSWFTSWITITVLGILSVLEIAAEKDPDARELLAEVDRYLKPAMAFLTQAGLISSLDVEFVEDTISQAGFGDYFFTIFIAGAVFFGSTLRSQFLSIFREGDSDDETGIQKIISWAEDFWVILAFVLLVLIPILVIILVGMISVGIVLARHHARNKEEQAQRLCVGCGGQVYRSAIACQNCRTEIAQPTQLGFLGQSTTEPATDLVVHRYRLVEKRRCPVCATRFRRRQVKQTCTGCGHRLMHDGSFAQNYVDFVTERVPRVTAICACLSSVPLLGLIPGIPYYRLMLVAPFAQYLPMRKKFLLTWCLRLLFFFFLIPLQTMPVIGVIALPSMAWLSYWFYCDSFRSLALTPVSALDESPVPSLDESAVPSLDESAVPSLDESAVPSLDESAVPSLDESAVPSLDESAVPSLDSGRETSEPPIQTPPPPPRKEPKSDRAQSAELTLQSETGRSIRCRIRTRLNKDVLRECGEDAQFADSEFQCDLVPVDGGWQVVPNPAAPNETLLNGRQAKEATPLNAGDVLSIGREDKGISKLPLQVQF